MKPSEVIRKYGWVQHELGYSKIGFCVMGALWHSYDNYKTCEHIYGHLWKNLSIMPEIWNDDPNRTKEEVIAMFETIGE